MNHSGAPHPGFPGILPCSGCSEHIDRHTLSFGRGGSRLGFGPKRLYRKISIKSIKVGTRHILEHWPPSIHPSLPESCPHLLNPASSCFRMVGPNHLPPRVKLPANRTSRNPEAHSRVPRRRQSCTLHTNFPTLQCVCTVRQSLGSIRLVTASQFPRTL